MVVGKEGVPGMCIGRDVFSSPLLSYNGGAVLQVGEETLFASFLILSAR